MKIYVNERGAVERLVDAQFVANASWESNVIDAHFNLPRIAQDCYCLVSAIRADGIVINDLQAFLEIADDGSTFYRYTIQSNDGVLYCKGTLQISVQLVDPTIGKKVLASATVSAHVFHNIGKQTQEEYDAFRDLINSESGILAGKINENIRKIDEQSDILITVVAETEKQKLTDIDVDKITGQGTKYFSTGVTETIWFPTSDVLEEKVDRQNLEILNAINVNKIHILDLKEKAAVVKLLDFTVDTETGEGVKYYSDGTTATVQYPTGGSGGGKPSKGFIREITFTEDNFSATGECAFSPAKTGFSTNRYLANVERTDGTGYEQTANSLFKGSDGSLLLSYNRPFTGRVLLSGAGSVTKGDPGIPNTLTIGTVTEGTSASAIITGESPNQTLSMVFPKGEKGETGASGIGDAKLSNIPGTSDTDGYTQKGASLVFSNPNLIINSNFQINQRGITEATESSVFIADHFRTNFSGTGTGASISNLGDPPHNIIRFISTKTKNAYLLYFFTFEERKLFVGKMITFTANITYLYGSGNHTITVRVNDINYAKAVAVAGQVSVTVPMPKHISNLYIQFGQSGEGESKVSFVKFELGSIYTLYTPPINDFPLCCRHYIDFGLPAGGQSLLPIVGSGVAYSSIFAYVFIPTTVPMFKQGTFICDLSKLELFTNGELQTPIELTNYSISKNGLAVRIRGNFINGQSVLLRLKEFAHKILAYDAEI